MSIWTSGSQVASAMAWERRVFVVFSIRPCLHDEIENVHIICRMTNSVADLILGPNDHYWGMRYH